MGQQKEREKNQKPPCHVITPRWREKREHVSRTQHMRRAALAKPWPKTYKFMQLAGIPRVAAGGEAQQEQRAKDTTKTVQERFEYISYMAKDENRNSEE
jgi:hypothetical protein